MGLLLRRMKFWRKKRFQCDWDMRKMVYTCMLSIARVGICWFLGKVMNISMVCSLMCVNAIGFNADVGEWLPFQWLITMTPFIRFAFTAHTTVWYDCLNPHFYLHEFLFFPPFRKSMQTLHGYCHDNWIWTWQWHNCNQFCTISIVFFSWASNRIHNIFTFVCTRHRPCGSNPERMKRL